jgi:hypothetical protein
MRKQLVAISLLFSFSAICAQETSPSRPASAALNGDERLAGIVAACAQGYPHDFEGIARDAKGAVVLRFKGRDFLYDDGKTKSFAELLDAPDIKDTFSQTYPLENPVDRLPENFDPGRFRVEELFKTLYGATESQVVQNCVTVNFCGNKVKFNARCGAADALTAVGKDLDQLFVKRPDLKAYVTNLGGTFNWRLIAGTRRLSNHSFATAIDLNVNKSAYWRSAASSKLATFSRKNWPVEIIQVFEEHGFIWGGKWWHYDTMHFEYRPELIAYARAHPSKPVPGPPGTER